MCLLVKPTSVISLFFFFNDTATTEIYTLSLHDALPIYGEFLRAHVAQPHGRVALLDGVPDSVHQMRLAHANPAVKEQRVVGFRRVFGNRTGRRMSKFVGLAQHERVEAVAGIELVVDRL